MSGWRNIDDFNADASMKCWELSLQTRNSKCQCSKHLNIESLLSSPQIHPQSIQIIQQGAQSSKRCSVQPILIYLYLSYYIISLSRTALHRLDMDHSFCLRGTCMIWLHCKPHADNYGLDAATHHPQKWTKKEKKNRSLIPAKENTPSLWMEERDRLGVGRRTWRQSMQICQWRCQGVIATLARG